MSKRRFKNKKIRYVAIGAAITSGAAVATLVLPSANAADEKTPDEIMDICHKAEKINGKQRSLEDIGAGFGDGFAADTCDFVETKFEAFDGPTEKVTVDFPNCEPNATDPAKVTTEWSTTVTQGKGTYTMTQQGGAGGLLGFIGGSWRKHKGTFDITIESAIAGESEVREVPVGKVLHMEFTPRMQRMTGVWKVHIDAQPETAVTNAKPEQNYEAEDVVEGPFKLEGVAGAPGRADGTTKAVLTDC